VDVAYSESSRTRAENQSLQADTYEVQQTISTLFYHRQCHSLFCIVFVPSLFLLLLASCVFVDAYIMFILAIFLDEDVLCVRRYSSDQYCRVVKFCVIKMAGVGSPTFSPPGYYRAFLF